MYMLHAPDPPRFTTSLRALVKLGVPVGLCNATVGQLEQAADLLEVAAVSVELSPSRPIAALTGVAAWSRRRVPW